MSYNILTISKIGKYLGLLSITYFLYKNIIYPYHLSPYKNLPRPRNTLLYYLRLRYYRITGNFLYFLQLIKNHGPIVHLSKQIVLVNDPEVKKYFLTYKFPKPSLYKVFDINGPNLFSSTNNKEFHQKIKKLLGPCFNIKNLGELEDTINSVGSESLVNYLKGLIKESDDNSGQVDLFHLFHCSTLDVISTLIFGTNLNTTNDQEKAKYYIKELGKTQKMMFKRTLIPYYNKIPFTMETLFKPLILKNIEERKTNPKNDILQRMLDSEDIETGEKLTVDEIIDECLILLFAGMDTTATTLTWTLYELIKNPDILKLVEDEINHHFPNTEEPIKLEKSKKELKYLDAVILECMRFHPVAGGGISREVPEGGVTIRGHYLPEKTTLLFRVYSMHHDPSIWSEPNKFDIERFLGPHREENKSKLLTFGLGPRSCIGRELALNEIYLVLPNLIRNFKFELKEELEPMLKFLYQPRSKTMKVKVTLKD